jgi:hypothetical protein
MVEECLIENIAVARWPQLRVWSIERAGINCERKNQVQTLSQPNFLRKQGQFLAQTSWNALAVSKKVAPAHSVILGGLYEPC